MYQQSALTNPDSSRAASILNFFAGVWLVTSPFFFQFTGQPMAFWISLLTGATVLTLTCVRLNDVSRYIWPSWVNLALGVFLAMTPFVFGYADSPRPFWNSVVLGILITLLAIWSIRDSPDGR